ncbi:unnamed protein product [Diabrotica balteata]|uniref:Uncharacterized protein n=1 Tax=Diabrotica balteata TaxID=107213 RepID=A0A9N9T5Y8_DIABA|nr:unnamed protein product [Diabrotica balteata]
MKMVPKCGDLVAIAILTVIFFKHFNEVRGQRDNLKQFQKIIRDTAEGKMGNFIIKYPQRKPNVRHQPYISNLVPFPCSNVTRYGLGRSRFVPTSVHQLLPGDIDIIGALGILW